MDRAILQFFEQIRVPFLDAFFAFFSFWGEGMALTVAVILAYWLLGRAGEFLAVTTLTTFPLNVFLKTTVARTRPYAASVVKRVEFDNFFVDTMSLNETASFPSGHSQTSATFLSATALRAKRIWAAVLCLVFTLLIMCSRLYFGVHYPSDVLAGFAIGIAVTVVWECIYCFAPNARFPVLCAVAVLALVPVFFGFDESYLQSAGLLAGVAVFLPLATRIAAPPKGAKRLWRIPLGLAAVAAVFALCLLLPDGDAYKLLTYFLIAGAATLGAQALFRLCKV